MAEDGAQQKWILKENINKVIGDIAMKIVLKDAMLKLKKVKLLNVPFHIIFHNLLAVEIKYSIIVSINPLILTPLH